MSMIPDENRSVDLWNACKSLVAHEQYVDLIMCIEDVGN